MVSDLIDGLLQFENCSGRPPVGCDAEPILILQLENIGNFPLLFCNLLAA